MYTIRVYTRIRSMCQRSQSWNDRSEYTYALRPRRMISKFAIRNYLFGTRIRIMCPERCVRDSYKMYDT